MSHLALKRPLAWLEEVTSKLDGDLRNWAINGNRAPGWPFWFVWVLASGVPGLCGAVVLLYASGLDPATLKFYLAAMPLAGVLMALPQGMVLQRYTGPGVMWALATAVGWALGWPAGIVLGLAVAVIPLLGAGEVLALFVVFSVAGIVAGSAAGTLQWWLVLKRRRVHVGWWMVASVAGMAAVGLMLWFPVTFGGTESLLAGIGAGMALHGGITGYALMRLLSRGPALAD